jgi:hypothetical protein
MSNDFTSTIETVQIAEVTSIGIQGIAGPGVVVGGTIGQALTKLSSTNYDTTWTTITKSTVGLGNVDNESKATMFASPTFTGTVTGVTASMVGLGNVTNESKATMFTSPTLTGTPIAPTAGPTTNTTQIATTEFVKTAVSNLINSAPAALDTLNELATALGNDANFATSVTNSLALKAPLANPTFTGTLTAATITASADATINGVTVGRGSTGISTNLALGSSALSGTLMSTATNQNVAVGNNALNNLKSSATGVSFQTNLGPEITFQEYIPNVQLTYVSGPQVESGGTYPIVNINIIDSDGSIYVNDTPVVDGGSRFTAAGAILGCNITSPGGQTLNLRFLVAAISTGSGNIAIGYNAGSSANVGQDSIYIGNNTNPSDAAYIPRRTNEIVIGAGAVGSGANTVTIGNTYTAITYLRGDVLTSGNLTAYGQINLPGTYSGPIDIGGSLGPQGTITLGSNGMGTFSIRQGTYDLFIGGTSSSGAITLGRSTGGQTVNIATGVNGGNTKTVNIGTNGTFTTNITIGNTSGGGTLTFGKSSGAQTVNIATGNNSVSTNIKTVNIGNGGSGASVTNVNIANEGNVNNIVIGSATGTSTTTLNGAVTLSGTSQAISIGAAASTGTITVGQSTGTQGTNIQAGATASGSTKTLSIGTGGLSGSTTNITMGSTAGASTTTINGSVTIAGASTSYAAVNVGIGYGSQVAIGNYAGSVQLGNGGDVTVSAYSCYINATDNPVSIQTSAGGGYGTIIGMIGDGSELVVNHSTSTFNSNVTVNGNLTINGTTTTINSNTVSVDDKNIELGAVAATDKDGIITAGSAIVTGLYNTANIILGSTVTSLVGAAFITLPAGTTVAAINSATQITLSAALTGTGGPTQAVLRFSGATDTTANGGGITLKGATDKTLTWSTLGWTSSEDFNLVTGKAYEINGTSVLSATTLGSGVTASSLTSLGIITSLNAGTITASNDATINGVTVGRGNGSAATNTALGFQALKLATVNHSNNVAVGYQTLDNLNGAGVGSFIITNQVISNYVSTSGEYLVYLEYVSGTASTTGDYGQLAISFRIDYDTGNLAISDYRITLKGSGYVDTTTVVRALVTDFDLGDIFYLRLQVNTLDYSSGNTAIGALAGSTVTGDNNIYLGYNAQQSNTNANNEIVIGVNAVGKGSGSIVIGGPDNYSGTTYLRSTGLQFLDYYGNTSYNASIVGRLSGTFAGDITSGTAVLSTLSANGSLQLTGSATANQNIASNQTSGSLQIGGTAQTSGTITIGGTGGTGTILLGISTNTQRVNINTGASGSGDTFIGGINATGVITLGRSTVAQTVNVATGAVGAGLIKTVNIGTGAELATAVTNVTVGGVAGIGALTFGQSVNAQTVNVATGTTLSGATKVLNIGTNGAAGSITSIAIGSTTGTSTTVLNGIVRPSALTASQAVFTDTSKNLVSKATTGNGDVVLNGYPNISNAYLTGTTNINGTLTVGASPGNTNSEALYVNIGAGRQEAGQIINIGTGGSIGQVNIGNNNNYYGSRTTDITMSADEFTINADSGLFIYTLVSGNGLRHSGGNLYLNSDGSSGSVNIGSSDEGDFFATTNTIKGYTTFSNQGGNSLTVNCPTTFTSTLKSTSLTANQAVFTDANKNLVSKVLPIAANEPYATLAYAATVTPTANTNVRITCTGNLTINAPAAAADGTVVRMWIIASGANRTVSLQNTIKVPATSAFTSPQTITAATKARITIQYDAFPPSGGAGVWELASFVNGY